MLPQTSYIYDEVGPYLEIDSQATLDYPFDWGAWLNQGDALDPDPAVTNVQISAGRLLSFGVFGNQVVPWISPQGASVGDWINVTCHIKTMQGREDTRSLRLKVVNR